ncbi:hypothetical protein N9089_00655 [Crocinitomicaceae bacterium]|nr:hypothetical protein [Crocinitomicaceae bacterium]
MAEIRSTMDMVMERAARLAAEAEESSGDEALANEGMRMAAAFLNGEGENLLEQLKSKAPEEQMIIRGGMARTMLRNILLPRDQEISEQSLLSLNGLQELSGNSTDIATICSELKQILEQYGQHREQVKQQFDESILNQLKMQLQQQGLAVDDEMALNPTMHPQYQEEWSKASAELNNQYNDALDQRKELIGQRFGI